MKWSHFWQYRPLCFTLSTNIGYIIYNTCSYFWGLREEGYRLPYIFHKIPLLRIIFNVRKIHILFLLTTLCSTVLYFTRCFKYINYFFNLIAFNLISCFYKSKVALWLKKTSIILLNQHVWTKNKSSCLTHQQILHTVCQYSS